MTQEGSSSEIRASAIGISGPLDEEGHASVHSAAAPIGRTAPLRQKNDSATKSTGNMRSTFLG